MCDAQPSMSGGGSHRGDSAGCHRRRRLTSASAMAPLSPLFDGYLSLGAKVCGAPAVDREFGTTDFLVLLDIEELEERTFRSLFG